MYGVIVGLIIVIAIFLILVVLAQNPKGGGLSSQFGGSGASQIMGVKKTGDFLEKATWGAAIAILVLSLATNFFIGEPTTSLPESPNINNTPAAAPSLPLNNQNTQPLPIEGLTGDDSL